MRPQYSGAERFETLKAKVQGDWFKMAKLKGLVDKDIEEAGRKAARLRVEGNRFAANAELYENDMHIFEGIEKGEKAPEAYEKEIANELNTTGDYRDKCIDNLKSQNRRLWVSNRNDGGKRIQAAMAWETLAKNLQKAFDDLGEEILAMASHV